MEKKILITICARGGSKGIPGKNIKLINRKPLIAYTIKHAMEFAEIHSCDIGLSTDSLNIKNTAAKYGLLTEYLRDPELANDTAGKLETISSLLFYEERKNRLRYDFIIDLDVTSPLRTIEDLEQAFNSLKENRNALNLFSVSVANRNPYFNMVERKENGFYSLVKPPTNNILARQAAPEVFDVNASLYIYRREFFNLGLKTVLSGKAIIFLMDHICFDLDDPVDFTFMEYLLKNNLLGFKI
jgi:CMP-N,N'-diacetyllegionaminic acid synthase